MGYSVGIRSKNKQLKSKMVAFMLKHYLPFSCAFKKFFPRFIVDYSTFSDKLEYDNNKTAIGFNYNACEPERDYIFAVNRWMALKIGKQRFFKGLGSVPFYVYDGYEGIPILPKSKWKNKIPKKYKWALTTDIGYKSLEMKYEGTPIHENRKEFKEYIKSLSNFMETDYHKICEHIEKELKRLDKLWEGKS